MNYTLHQLHVFREVVRQESITRAAEEMHMTQPALSIQLRNFQAQFKVPLTEVIGRRLYITEYGRVIAELAGNVLREAEAIWYKTKEYEGILAGRLSISSASTGKYVIPYFLSEFLKQHPGIDLLLDVTNKIRAITSLKNNLIDFALVSVVPDDLEVEEEILIENRLFMIGKPGDIEKDKPFIFREEGSATRMIMDHFLNREVNRKKIELTSNEAVKQAVLAGLGNSLIPLIGIRNELRNNELTTIPFKSLPIVTHWRLIWLKNKKFSPVAEAYLEHIRKYKQEIAGKNFQWYLEFGAAS